LILSFEKDIKDIQLVKRFVVILRYPVVSEIIHERALDMFLNQ
jgi:hypothetical protein